VSLMYDPKTESSQGQALYVQGLSPTSWWEEERHLPFLEPISLLVGSILSLALEQ
jgi:hypothetical protein